MRPTLIGLPYDASSSHRRGAAEAPPRIREALASPASNLWSESLLDVGGVLADAGDLDLPPSGAARDRIEASIRRLIEAGGAPIALGGDHSITLPILRALGPRFPGLAVVQIDAHPDLYDAYGSDRFSHACPFARILEERLAGSLIQVGIRAGNAVQREQAARFGVETIDMRGWAAGRRPAVPGPTYLSIDLDGIDPAFAPGVAHPEPGGLAAREVVGLIQALAGPLVGADLVELNPGLDPTGITAVVAAKLVKEIAARMVETGGGEL